MWPSSQNVVSWTLWLRLTCGWRSSKMILSNGLKSGRWSCDSLEILYNSSLYKPWLISEAEVSNSSSGLLTQHQKTSDTKIEHFIRNVTDDVMQHRGHLIRGVSALSQQGGLTRLLLILQSEIPSRKDKSTVLSPSRHLPIRYYCHNWYTWWDFKWGGIGIIMAAGLAVERTTFNVILHRSLLQKTCIYDRLHVGVFPISIKMPTWAGCQSSCLN